VARAAEVPDLDADAVRALRPAAVADLARPVPTRQEP